jgi:hypothetical protein
MSLLSKRQPQEYSPTAGLPFDDEELEARLVWIWTSARSGSTWLLRLLAHPLRLGDAPNDPEAMLGFHAPEGWGGKVDVIPVDTTFIANHLAPPVGTVPYDASGNPVTFGSFPGMAGKPSYFFCRKYEDLWRPELRRMMLVRFHGWIERAAERMPVEDPLILLKEVAGGFGAGLVMSLFPRSRFVFLVRDGRDVVDSQAQANQPGGWMPTPEAFTTPDERLEFIRQRSRAWVGETLTIERAFEAHPPELRRLVRYEDLLSDTRGTLEPLVEWLGIRRGQQWLERSIEVNAFEKVPDAAKGPTKFFRTATPGYWRESLTPAEQEAAKEIMGQKLAELGYAS